MLWLVALFACDPGYMEFSGKVAESSFKPVTGFFGGSYIIFFNREMDCKETHWVTNIYRNGEAPYDKDLEALQITYNDSNVEKGTYATGGEAPIRVAYLNIDGEAFEKVNATEGQMTTKSVDEEWTEGTFAFTFGDTALEGEYFIPYCTNLER